MKLIIKQEGKRGIRFWFPTRLIFSKTAFKVFRRSLEKSAEMENSQAPESEDWEEVTDYRQLLDDGVDEETPMALECEEKDAAAENSRGGFDFEAFMANLPDEKIDQILKIFHRMRKDHPGVPLVDVRSAEGDRVLIQ